MRGSKSKLKTERLNLKRAKSVLQTKKKQKYVYMCGL